MPGNVLVRSVSAIGHVKNPDLKGNRRNERTIQEFQRLSPGMGSILRLFEGTLRDHKKNFMR